MPWMTFAHIFFSFLIEYFFIPLLIIDPLVFLLAVIIFVSPLVVYLWVD